MILLLLFCIIKSNTYWDEIRIVIIMRYLMILCFVFNNITILCVRIFSEKLFMKAADLLVSEGYAEAGYQYLIVDDCWLAKNRSADGKLEADKTRFPSGIKALSDYVSLNKSIHWCYHIIMQPYNILKYYTHTPQYHIEFYYAFNIIKKLTKNKIATLHRTT